MIYNIQYISKQTKVISMQKLKLVRSFCLLLALLMGAMPSIVGAQMRTVISSLSGFPLQDNYCDGSYSLVDTSGISADNRNTHLCPQVSVDSVPATTVGDSTVRFIVDWVLVELRAVSNGGTAGSTVFGSAVGSTVIARKPGFLLNNRRVVEASTYAGADPMACTALTMSGNCLDVEFSEGDVATATADNDLYVVVRHRNHLDIISANRITESDGEAGVYAYDFTVANSDSEESGSTYVMLGGDTDGNGLISSADNINEVLPNSPATNTYQAGDVTLDGNVTSADNVRAILPNSPAAGTVPQ